MYKSDCKIGFEWECDDYDISFDVVNYKPPSGEYGDEASHCEIDVKKIEFWFDGYIYEVNPEHFKQINEHKPFMDKLNSIVCDRLDNDKGFD